MVHPYLWRTLITCGDPKGRCPFTARRSDGEGIPVRGRRRIDEVGWERAARAAVAEVAAQPRVGDASLAIAAYHEHLRRACWLGAP